MTVLNVEDIETEDIENIMLDYSEDNGLDGNAIVIHFSEDVTKEDVEEKILNRDKYYCAKPLELKQGYWKFTMNELEENSKFTFELNESGRWIRLYIRKDDIEAETAIGLINDLDDTFSIENVSGFPKR